MDNTFTPIDVIYEDQELIAINKPHGLLVHRSRIANDVKVFALQLVRDYVGHYVYPVHRLDRKTSGVLLFAKSPEVASQIQTQFLDGSIQKTYLALVRGHVDQKGEIDYPIGETTKLQEAYTSYSCLAHYEIDYPSHYHPTSRYSLVEVHPQTGRFHQIRKHMAHIRHPIIGDRPHGCNKQNRFWKETFNMLNMLLHAKELSLMNLDGESLSISCEKSIVFNEVLNKLSNINLLHK
jgi:tRNA pseudouridine65 synthase